MEFDLEKVIEEIIVGNSNGIKYTALIAEVLDIAQSSGAIVTLDEIENAVTSKYTYLKYTFQGREKWFVFKNS